MHEAEKGRSEIGRLLLRRGTIDREQLSRALEGQRRSGRRLASECLALDLAKEGDLLSALSAQAGVPGVCVGTLITPLKYLDTVPQRTALKHRVLPVQVDAERVFVAMSDPRREDLLAEIGFFCKRQVLGCVALCAPLSHHIEQAYAAKRQGELELRGVDAPADARAGAPLSLVLVDSVTHVPEELAAAMPSSGSAVAEGEILVDLGDGDEVDTDDVEVGDLYDVDEDLSHPEGDREEPAVEQVAARVLVVDDDEETRRLVARILSGEGLDVDEAGRGLEALSRVKDSPPDLIILDAMLPEVHGFDIARKIRASDRYAHIPIIMVSSVYRGWRIARDLEQSYGVAAFLEKPFKITDLIAAVRRALASRSRRGVGSTTAISAHRARKDGIALYEAGDLAGAMERFKEAVRIDPFSARLHFQLGVLYLKKRGLIYQAMREFEEAVALDPGMFAALRSLAILYQRKGFRNKAIDMWERALQHSPDVQIRERIRKHLIGMIRADA